MAFSQYDLGIAAYGAVRVGAGFIPYVDMYMLYGPAPYYMRALLFHIFGTNIAVVGVEFAILSALFVGASYWVLRGCLDRGPALLITFTVAMVAIFTLQQHGLSFVAMIIAIGCIVRYAARPSLGWLIGAGIAIGLTGASRWDFGGYCALAFTVGLLGLPYFGRVAGPKASLALPIRKQVGRYVLLVTTAVLTALPFYAPALFTDPLAVLRPIQLLREAHAYRVLPWPDLPSVRDVIHAKMTFPQFLEKAMIVFPAYAFHVLGPVNAVVVIFALCAKLPKRPSAPLLLHTTITTLLGAGMLVYGSSRADIGHTLALTVLMLLSLPLIVWLVTQLRPMIVPWASWVRWGLNGAGLLIAVPTALFGFQTITQTWSAARPPGSFSAPRLAGVIADPATIAMYDALVNYVDAHTTPNEYIFSGNLEHDQLLINDVLIYFASERQAGVRDYHMDPGTTTGREIQQRIIHDLQRNNVRLIVLADFGVPNEPNRSRVSSGVTDFDDFIRQHYVVQAQFGSYYVLQAGTSANVACGVSPIPGAFGAVDAAIALPSGGTSVHREGRVRLFGWAAAPAGSSPIQNVEVWLNGNSRTSVLQCTPRPDIADHYGKASLYIGWETDVAANSLGGVGPVDVSADAIDSDGVRRPLPISPGFKLEVAP
jgi:hypothetical protein